MNTHPSTFFFVPKGPGRRPATFLLLLGLSSSESAAHFFISLCFSFSFLASLGFLTHLLFRAPVKRAVHVNVRAVRARSHSSMSDLIL